MIIKSNQNRVQSEKSVLNRVKWGHPTRSFSDTARTIWSDHVSALSNVINGISSESLVPFRTVRFDQVESDSHITDQFRCDQIRTIVDEISDWSIDFDQRLFRIESVQNSLMRSGVICINLIRFKPSNPVGTIKSDQARLHCNELGASEANLYNPISIWLYKHQSNPIRIEFD